MWPTEPARAGWSFNKWRKTRILKQLRRHHRLSNRPRSVHALAAAREVAAAPVDVAVVVAAVADEEDLVPVAGVALRADRVVASAAARADHAAVAVDAAKAKAVTATDAEMVEASSSRT